MSLDTLKRTAREYWPLAAIMLLGLLLRLPSPDGSTDYLTPSEFLRDLAVLKNMDAGRFPLIGLPSTVDGFRFGPFYIYLHFPLAKLGGFTPYSLALTGMAVSLAAIPLCYATAKAWFKDRRIALLAAGLLAVSILDISVAKYGSSPNTGPFFALLFFYQLEKFLDGRSTVTDAVLLGLAWGAASQLHAIPLISLSLALGAALLLSRSKDLRRQVPAIFLAAGAIMAPYLCYLAANGFSDVKALAGAMETTANSAGLLPRYVDLANFVLAFFVRFEFFLNADPVGGMAVIMANVLVVALIWLLETRRRRQPASGRSVGLAAQQSLALWATLPTLVLLLPVSHVGHMPYHYFIILVPVGYLLLALGLDRMARQGLRYTAGAVLASFALWQIAQIIQYHLDYPSVLTAWLAGA